MTAGSISFFVAAFVIPFLFFLFSLSLDLSKYYTETQKAQKAADDAALFAYRFLPFGDQAVIAARNFLNDYGNLAEGAEITADGHSVSIALNATSALSFARLFGLQAGVPMAAYARAWGTPLDAFIALDSSAQLGPAVPTGTPWGESDQWPAAYFFDALHPLYNQGVQIDPRLLTQRCFNPAFSALKKAAIAAYDYLSISPQNAVGVGFYPGAVSPLDLARDTLPGGVVDAGRGEARFETLQSTVFSRHEWCAAAAELEVNHQDYRLPLFSDLLRRSWDPEDGRPTVMIDPSDWSFDSRYQPYLQAREVIWGRALQEGPPAAISGPSISALLRETGGRLLGAAGVSARGTLIGRARKTAIIFAADVPWEGDQRFPSYATREAMEAEFGAMRNQIQQGVTNINIYYLLFRHAGNESADFDLRVEELRSFLELQSFDLDRNIPSKFAVKLVFASSPESLVREIPALLVLERKSAMLAR